MNRLTRRLLSAGAAIAAGLALAGSAPLARAADTIELFNGKDLTNFYTWLAGPKYEDPNHVFTVVEDIDGAPAIRVSGQGYGAFITKQEFSNYKLEADYRWGNLTWLNRKGRSRDSGILVHCQGKDGNTGKDFNGPWMRSIECQVIEGGTGDIIPVAGYDENGTQSTPTYTATARKDPDGQLVYDPNEPAREIKGSRLNWFGRDPEWKDVLGFRGKQDVESPYPKWTHVEVICDGDNMTNLVNGTIVNKATKCSQTSGKIIFQAEGAELYYRNIKVTPLR
jgi:hypothetical protein